MTIIVIVLYNQYIFIWIPHDCLANIILALNLSGVL